MDSDTFVSDNDGQRGHRNHTWTAVRLQAVTAASRRWARRLRCLTSSGDGGVTAGHRCNFRRLRVPD
ncbi:DNA-polymerase III subunit gamma/tau [Sesbania bispinosa]|nr:DNA-polymerase III subunit gamma/tau [Sesbania bispinosa]